MRRACAALGALIVLAGCGGDGGGGAPDEGDAAQVARAWTDAIRERDYAAATDLFAVPATVANGTPRVRLKTRRQVDEFNRSLPCGATVTGTEALNEGYVRVRFELTEGPGCGGAAAEVTMRVVDGRITEWLREAVGPPPGTTET